MYKIIGMVLIIAITLTPHIVQATDDKYCALMFAIYGVCSPQLIDNYLVMTSRQANPPRTVFPTVSHAMVNQSSEVLKPVIREDNCNKKVLCGGCNGLYWGGESGWWTTLPPFCPRIGKAY